MKQSTKLLSLVLALVMAFSCMTVIGNAALVQVEVAYDSIDDAALAPEQVADMALDLVENDLLADVESLDLSILGELRLNKLDYILEDVVRLRSGFVWSIGSGLIGDLGDFNFDPIKKSGSWGTLGIGASAVPYKRSDGDIVFVGQLLSLLNSNADIVSKAAYGLNGGSGISLGLISAFLDLGEIGDMLGNIPNLIASKLYDLLIFGSYGYPDSYEDLGSLPADVNTLDKMVNTALYNLITKPQDYSWEGEGDAAVKEWDKNSVVLPSASSSFTIDDVTPLSHSLFQILDTVAQVAIDDLAISALNYNLKKTLMKAVDIDFNEIAAAQVDAKAKAVFDKEEDYVTYIAYDCLEKGADGEWYYTTMETVTELDASGNPVLDEEGNEVTTKARKYFKANMAGANEFAPLINWDWKFVGSNAAAKEGEIQLLYNNIIKDYDGDGVKSIAEGFNDLIGLVYDAALSSKVKADFEALVGTGFVKGNNSNFMTNVNNIVKYLLVNHGDMIFGSSSPYASLKYSEIKDLSTVELVAMIGPSFFEDVMPQIIFPKNADGTYAFHDGVQVYEFGALVIREFASNIAPNVNYDAYIFAEGTVGTEKDRHFKVQGTEQWANLILNMGVDIGYTYLYNITNFGDRLTYNAGGTYTAGQKGVNVTRRGADYYPAVTSTNVYDDTRWSAMLDEAIMWGARYVGGMETSSVLNGFDPAKLAGITGEGSASPLNKLSYILNSILPLGFISGYSTDAYAFDLNKLLNEGLKPLLADFDLSRVIALFGRNQNAYNFLDDTNLVNAALNIVNNILKLVFNATILQDVNATNAGVAQSIDAVIDQASLKVTIKNLLTALYARKDAILLNALPVVGKLINGWGTEQEYATPVISLSNSFDLKNGATTEAQTVTVRNAAEGVWRHYIDPVTGEEKQDSQYKIKLTDVKVYDQMSIDGSSPFVSVSFNAANQQPVDFGSSATFTFTASGVSAPGTLVRFDIKYVVYDESGSEMANGQQFLVRKYVWLNYNPSDAGTKVENNSSSLFTAIYTPQYVPLSNALDIIPTLTTSYWAREHEQNGGNQTASISATTPTVDGLTFANVEQTFANNNDGRFMDIRNFDTYEETYTNEDGEQTNDKYKINGSIDEAAWLATNKKSGDKTEFEINLKDNDGTEKKTLSLIYYDDIALNKLTSLASSEMSAARLEDTYNLTGKFYANGILSTANSKDSNDEVIYRESNFTTTAWVAEKDAGKWAGSYTTAAGDTVTETVAVYEEAQVTDIITVEENGVVVSATGKVGDVDVKKVTVIDCLEAALNYAGAFVNGVQGAYQAFNAATSVYDFEARYEALYVTSNDIAVCKKSAEQTIAEGQGSSIESTVSALKDSLDSIEAATTDNRNHTDYKMWRLDRLNDARDDARYYVQLWKDQSNPISEIDSRYPYTGMIEADLKAIVKANDVLDIKGGTNNANLVEALLEVMNEEELEAQTNWLDSKKTEYRSQQLIDVEMAATYLELTSQRLLPKYDEVITTYLDDELTSVELMIGNPYEEEVAAQYTERSWNKFFNAYEKACLIYEGTEELPLTQKNVYDVKYELLCCRNELVRVGEEADYTELEALIAQAEYALDNMNLYNNTAKELGQVLAELGLADENGDLITLYNADGDSVDIFPGSAHYINNEPYTEEDQDVIDQKATELKEALARLKFKGLNITDADGKANTSTGILVEGDEENGIKEVTATIAKIAAELDADAVKGLFQVTADSANVGVDNITVSNDLHYSVEKLDEEGKPIPYKGFAGTNSVVTFYTVAGGVKIPVATVKIVVDGDINGDGAVDVLDGAYAQLVSNQKAELEGCYLLAGDLSGNDREVLAADYQQIVGIIVA